MTVTITATDKDNRPVQANLSLAVTDAGSVPPGQSNIVAYLNLQSEIRGTIDNPAQYFDAANPNRSKYLDLLLITQGWRDFVWKRLADSALHISHQLEQGITITGRVRQVNADKPVPDANITLFASKASGNKLFITQANENGNYALTGLKLFGAQSLVLTSVGPDGKRGGWLMIDSLSADTLPVPQKQVPKDTLFKKSTFFAEAMKRKSGSWTLRDTIALKEVKVTAPRKNIRVWGGALTDLHYPEDNFTITAKDQEYKDLEHFLNTKLIHNNGGINYLFINGREIFFDDSIKTDVLYPYLRLPMESFEKVIKKRYINISNEDVYVLYLTIKPGVFEYKEYNKLHALVNGYYDARTFYAPSHEASGNKADLRTTISWQPDIKLDDKGEAIFSFYNCDSKAPIRIVAEGLSTTGIPIIQSKNYSVK